jgi:hypothetical protein
MRRRLSSATATAVVVAPATLATPADLEADPLALEDRAHLGGDVLVLARQHPGAASMTVTRAPKRRNTCPSSSAM